MRHIQNEPVWGGQSDTAGTLRATCALALVQCRSLSDADLLTHLIELAGDKDKAVRTEAMRAIEQVGSPPASLLLRLRAILGADEPEVLGACYSGILRLEGAKAIPWIARFLATADDNAAEAALAIAGTHSPEGFDDSAGMPHRRRTIRGGVRFCFPPSLSHGKMRRWNFCSMKSARNRSAPRPRSKQSCAPCHRPKSLSDSKQLTAGNPRLARIFAANQDETRSLKKSSVKRCVLCG